MRYLFTIAFFTIVCANTLFAQTIRFNNAYDFSNTINYYSKPVFLNDTEMVCISNSYNTPTFQGAHVFVKLKNNGTIISQKSIDFDSTIVFGPEVIMMSSDSFIYAFAQMKKTNKVDPWLMITKYNKTGDTLWTTIINDTAAVELFYDVSETNDKKIIAFGVKNHTSDITYNHYWLCKIDTNGQVLWQHTYGPNGKHSYGRSVSETPTHGFVLNGWLKVGYDANFPTQEDDNFLIIKTDSVGTAIWTKQYGDTAKQFGLGVVKCKSGGYLLTGGDEKYTPSTTTNNFPEYAGYIKIDENGTKIWKQRYCMKDCFSADAGIRKSIELADGSFVSYGVSEDFNISKIYTILQKIDSVGNLKWSRTYVYKDTLESQPFDFTQTPDGGFIVSGFVQYSNGADGWLLKVDSVGCLVGGCQQWDEVEEIQLKDESEKLILYPNPVGNELSVIGYQLLGNTIQVYDVLGREMYCHSEHFDKLSVNSVEESKSIALSVGNLSSGIYFIKVGDKNGNIKCGKFVKE